MWSQLTGRAGVIGSGLLALSLLGATLAVYRTSATASVVPPPVVTVDPVSQGRTLFQSKGCIGCHNVSDKRLRSQMGFAPDLAALAQRAPILRPSLTPDAYIRESVRQPQAFVVPGFSGNDVLTMPTLPVTDPELDALVAFLLS